MVLKKLQRNSISKLPVKIGKHIFKTHEQAVKFVKKTNPRIIKADAFVASIERKQNLIK